MIEFLEIFFFGQGDVQMAVIDPIIGGALISGGIQILGGIVWRWSKLKEENEPQKQKKIDYKEN